MIDALGGMETAIDLAVEAAKLGSDYKLNYYPIEKSFVEKILADFQSEAKIYTLKTELGNYYGAYSQISKLKKLQGVQARLPLEMIIE